MKKVLKWGAWALAVIVVVGLAAWFWASQVTASRYEKQWTVHKAEFPIPFPLKADEIPPGADPQALALKRAVQRGRHLVDSRVSCDGCHAKDFGGAAVIDVPLVARWVAPNLTTGKAA